MNGRTVIDESTKIWSGVGPSMPSYDSEKSVGSAVLSALEEFPDKIGQISENNGIQLTNADIRWRTIRAAQNLTKLGFGFNDVIQVISTNHHYLAPIIFAALTIGAPVNAIDVKFTKDEIAHMLHLAKPKLILCDINIIGNVKTALKELQLDRPIFTFDGHTEGTQNIEVLFDETNVEEFEIPFLVDAQKHAAIIVCTSGTTGLPKGVCLSHASLLSSNRKGLTSDDVMLNFSSLYWLTGWGTLLMSTLQSATRIISTKSFNSEMWLRLVQQHKVTVTLTPPHYVAMILQDPKLETSDISTLRMYLCTGGMVSQDLCDRMNKRLTKGAVVVAYAMSETSGAISMNISSLRPGAVGQLLPGFNAKIINEEEQKCGIDQDGEIYFKPYFKFLGYYGDVEKTNKTMDADGWIRTGDVGHFDSEGFLYLVDRKKEILKYCGDQVSPSQLENVLMQIPGIANVCVVGISDDIAGELPAAVVMKSATVDVSEEEIHAYMKEKLSTTKQLRGGVYFVESLPVTPSGKVLRRKVMEIAEQQYKKSDLFLKI